MSDRAPAALKWPEAPPTSRNIILRQWRNDDVDAVVNLATCPYTPLVGTLPAHANREESLAYIRRQQGRLKEGRGFSFCTADAHTDEAYGGIGLWLREDSLVTGRATLGYAVCPAARGRGVARHSIEAVLGFAWTIPELHRVEAYIEPWNKGSWRAAQRAGMAEEGRLHSHQEIDGRRVDMLLFAAVRPPSVS